jgi:putative transcriptional regulator
LTLIYYQIIIKEKAQQKRGVFILIHYKINILEELKKKGYTSYIIRKNKYLSEGTLAKIKRGEPINMKSLNAICCMLRKNVNDVIEVEITDDEKIKYFI